MAEDETAFNSSYVYRFLIKLATKGTRPITVISSLCNHAFVVVQAILTGRGLLINTASITIFYNFLQSASFITAFLLNAGGSSSNVNVSPLSNRGQEIRGFVFFLNNLVSSCISSLLASTPSLGPLWFPQCRAGWFKYPHEMIATQSVFGMCCWWWFDFLRILCRNSTAPQNLRQVYRQY